MADAPRYLASKLAPGLAGLLAVVAFVRLVGAEEYGVYMVLLSSATAWAAGASGWLGQAVLRYRSQFPGRAGSLFGRQVGRAALASSFCAAAGLTLTVLVLPRPPGGPELLAVGAVGLLATLHGVLVSWYQASLRAATVARLEGLRSVAILVFPLTLVLASRPRARELLAGAAAAYAITIVYGMRADPSMPEDGVARHARVPLRQLWDYGWPVSLWFLLLSSIPVSERYFLQGFRGFAVAGVYVSLYEVVVRAFSLVFAPLAMAVHPRVMASWSRGDQAGALRMVRSALVLEICMLVPILLAAPIAAPWLVRFVTGRPDVVAAQLVVPLTITGFTWQVSGLLHKPLEILCLTQRMLLAMLLAFATGVAANSVLTPKLGAVGTAWVSVLSSATYVLAVVALTPWNAIRRDRSRDLPGAQP